jgi:TRAP-type C4-dicarboxylate transport system permease small subunit
MMTRFLDKIEKVFIAIGVVSAFAMTSLTTFDALGRYLFSRPIIGVYEISEHHLMVFCFYFALCYAYREGVNIRITLLVSHLPRQMGLILKYIVQVISILFCLFLFTTALIINLPRIGENLTVVDYIIPMGPAYMAVNIGLFMLCLRMTLDLWQIKYGKSGLFKGDETEESSAV